MMLQDNNDKAPLFKSWNIWYVLVLAFLVLLIIFFKFFTNYFA